MRTVFFILGITTLLTACGNQPSPTLHVNVYCRYDQQEGKIRAEATYFEGDTLRTARAKVFQSGVSFLGSGMEARNLPDGTVRYETERSINLPEQLPLFFKENPNREKTILLPLHPISDFGFDSEVVSKSEGATLRFGGEPLSDAEKLILLFTDANQQNVSVEINGPVNSGEIKISPQSISTLVPGPAELYLVRTNLKQSREDHHEISLQTEFYSKIIKVNIGR